MAGLSREVEKIIFSLHEVAQAVGIANIRDIDLHPVLQSIEVVKISAVIRNEAVHDRDHSAQANEPAGEIRTDKAQAAGDQHLRSFKFCFHEPFQLLHAWMTASPSASVMNGWSGNDTSLRANRRAFSKPAELSPGPAFAKAVWSGMIRG